MDIFQSFLQIDWFSIQLDPLISTVSRGSRNIYIYIRTKINT